MKKICLVNFDMSVSGGAEQVSAALSAALADRYEVHILSLCMTGKLVYDLDPRVKFHALLPQEERLRTIRRKLKPMILRYFRENHIEAAIAQGNYSAFLLSAVRGQTSAKLIFCDHGALMNQWHQKDIVLIRLLASHLCHRVVTLTEQSREDYHRKLLVSRKKLCCIPNWIDLELSRSESYAEDSRKIISAGRFGPEKGFEMLVEIFAKVVKRCPDVSLDLYGDGENRPLVEEKIRSLHMEPWIHLMGMRRDLAMQYRNYALYVLPSYREGMPLVLLEAKANRLPIVSFDIMTGPREIVRDGIDGVLIPPYDQEKMADAICHLMEDSLLRKQMSCRSQENLSKFDKETILKQWTGLIESL